MDETGRLADEGSGRTAARHYGLVLRMRSGGIVWRFRNEGVILEEDGITWHFDGDKWRGAYADISTIHLSYGHLPRAGAFGNCRITFKNGRLLAVASLSTFGNADPARAPIYADFVRDLHARLSAEDRRRIRFVAGNSEGQQAFGKAVFVIAAAFFVGLPVFLAMATGELKAGFLAFAGILFVYPLYLTLRRNHPRDYSAEAIPADLLP